jgi:subtilisin
MTSSVLIRILFAVILLAAATIQVTGNDAALAGSIPRGEQPDRYFVVFENEPGDRELELIKRSGGKIRHSYDIVPAVSALLTERSLRALQRQQSVERIEPVLEVFPTVHLDAEAEGYQWGANHIGAHLAHEMGYFGEGIAIAVLDTGIDTAHRYLDVESEVDCTEPGCPDGQEDGHGHGTHVAGSIAASQESPVTGVAPDATIHAVKVLRDHDGGGFTDDVLAGLQWAADNDIQITNNSYGFDSEPFGPTIQQAYAETYNAGILHITSAGNTGNESGDGDLVMIPARYDEVLAVAASEEDDTRRASSSTGPCLELAAPGAGIESTTPGGGTRSSSGTSMAAPHVSGAAALVWAEHQELENHDIRAILSETAMDIGDPDHFGQGLVQVIDAITFAEDEYEPSSEAESSGSFVSDECDLPGDFYLDVPVSPGEWRE